jgi:hypothetical protein
MLPMPTPSLPPPTTPSVAVNVDFWLRFTSSSARDKENPTQVTVAVELGNAGAANATQPVRFVLISPFYANFANPSDLDYFNRYVVQNPSPQIPEMVEFEVPADKLASREGIHLEVPLDVIPNGPRIFDMVYGCIETTADNDTTLLNNEALGTVGVPIHPLADQPPGTTAVNYYFVVPPPRINPGQSGHFELHLGNAGNNGPSSDAVFIFVSPYRVKVNRAMATVGLQATFLHGETDVGIPDLMTFPVPRLLLPPDPNLLTLVTRLGLIHIPVTNYGNAHSARSGKGFLAAAGNDFDRQTDIAMNRMPIVEPI